MSIEGWLLLIGGHLWKCTVLWQDSIAPKESIGGEKASFIVLFKVFSGKIVSVVVSSALGNVEKLEV